MYLKAIELVGFKSFAERVRLDFAEGLTTIVGANGSGKSNIVDAVLWVMGEQNARNLRGAKMEEIIFSGSEKRRAVGMAEVTLIIDNQSKLLPVEYEEVSVMRRLFRDGTSEYYINQQQCRLKDIVEMFLDTGVGRDSFSIIGQGQIDEILSYKPAERRVILEEVAGIAKFKFRKKEALSKLERLQDRLQRVDDIVLELNTQITPLQQQAQAAELYLYLREELKKHEITYLVSEHRRISKEYAERVHFRAKAEEAYTAGQARTAVEMAVLEKIKLEQLQTEQQIESLNLQSNQLLIELEQKKGEERIIQQRILHDTSLRDQYSNEEKSDEIREKDLHRQLAEIESEQQKNDQEVGTRRTELERLRQDILSLTAEEETNRKKEQELLEHYHQNSRDLHLLQGRLEGLNRDAKAQEQTLAIVKKEIAELTTQLNEKKTRLKQIVSETEEDQKALLELTAAALQQESEYQEQVQAANELKNVLSQHQASLRISQNRMHMLSELSDQMEGYFKGVKAIMQAKKQGHSAMKGIHEPLANLFRVDKAHETAIEMILGGALQNIVVNQPEDAEKAIAWLKQSHYGRATFYPLSSIRGQRDEQLWSKIKDQPGVLAIASDLVQTEQKYNAIKESLLGNVVVMQTLTEANKLAKELNLRYRIVTLEGDIIVPGGAITGGSLYQKGVSLLGREREIGELERSIQEQKKQIQQLEVEEVQKRKQIEQCEALMDIVKSDKEKAETQLQQSKLKQQLLQAEISTFELSKDKKIAEETSLQDLYGSSQRQTAELQLEQKRIQALDLQLLREIDCCKEISHSSHIQTLQAELQSGEVQMALHQRRKEELDIQYLQLQEVLLRFRQDVHLKQDRIAEINQRLAESATECQQVQLESQRIGEKQQETELKHQSSKAKGLKLKAELSEQEERIYSARKNEDQCRESFYHENNQWVKSQSELQFLLDKVQNDYNTSPEELPQEPLVAFEDLQELQKACTRFRNKIREMGMVNLGAIEEKKRLEERKSYLSEQGEDIRISCQGIYKVLAEIDKDMESRFEEAFQTVNYHFQQVFTQLFQGGQAKLQLTEPQDLLNTGLDIIAQLPGKKAGNLSLLSGGERALTAVALLIAILQVKKPPFCLLDEVETSLDEANVKRVAKILRTCSDHTQIISVSHRKGMMEEADALIGVTMQSPGISTVISVRFGEKDKQE